MPMYNLVCELRHEQFDVFLKVGERPPCPECGGATETLWKTSSANVIADTIPGGVWIRHGLCDEVTGDPVKYYSKSEITAEAKRRGLYQGTGKPYTPPKHTKYFL